MKLYHYTLLFLALFLCLCTSINFRQMTLEKMNAEKERYDIILEAAVNDAAASLVVLDRGLNPGLQKEEAVQTFFQSMYAGFGILHDELAMKELREYVPLLLITVRDGFYVWYRGQYEDGARNLGECLSEKYPYAYCVEQEHSNGEISDTWVGFTVDEIVRVVSGGHTASNRNTVFYGTRQDAAELFPELSFLKDAETFEEMRRETVINTISAKINQYINCCNRIARHYKLTYQFSVPYLDEATWARTLDDIAVVAFFQGYPFGNHITGIYNQYAVGGARVYKRNYYYITGKNENLFYHRKSCKAYHEDLIPYDSKRECALTGAYPCKKCKP